MGGEEGGKRGADGRGGGGWGGGVNWYQMGGGCRKGLCEGVGAED